MMSRIALLAVAVVLTGVVGCARTTADVGDEARKNTPPNIKPGRTTGATCVNPKDGAAMVWIPAGEFTMGSSNADISALTRDNPLFFVVNYKDEKPQRKVYLDGYWMYKYEVTVAQYRKFCEATNKKMPEAPNGGWKDDHPIVSVTWKDATDFANWAGVLLPTEAQWEKAARGTDGRVYPWGCKASPPTATGNFADKSMTKQNSHLTRYLADIGCPALSVYDDGYATTSPVGEFPAGASPYGCMDMAGNVVEWCADWYSATYYKSAPTRNPKGPKSSLTGERVVRGSCWTDGRSGHLCCAYRQHNAPADSSYNHGFRCAKTP